MDAPSSVAFRARVRTLAEAAIFAVLVSLVSLVSLLSLVSLAAGCSTAPATPATRAAPVSPAPPANAKAARATEPLFPGLGTFGRHVTTQSREAQRYFDQGLAFLYAFNHDEAIRSFAEAAAVDEECAMAYWGVALANGPHINNPSVDDAHAKAAWQALAHARRLAPAANPVERALIEALARRYAYPQPAERAPLDRAYADAMRGVWRAYPTDPDVGALFAEALMDLRPWDLWTTDGKAQPGTDEIIAVLDGVIERVPHHPLANHLYIHALEASPSPEKADAAADRLRASQPGLGHLVHMPSHIDVRRGRWHEAAVANENAIEADRAYASVAEPPGFYLVYMAHNHHMLAYSAMMLGQSERALRSIRAMVGAIPKEALQDKEMAAYLDGFLAMPLEVLMRFGRWDELLREPEIQGSFPIYRALRHYALGVAHAAKGNVKEAEASQRAFLEAKAQTPKGARFGNNSAADLLEVASHFLAGEIAARASDWTRAVGELEEAVRREDALRYDEPPDWIVPARHALGATLLKARRAQDAEAVYREDLRRLPENGWSLLGLARSLKARGAAQEAAAADARFRKAWAHADIALTSSCFCQPWAAQD